MSVAGGLAKDIVKGRAGDDAVDEFEALWRRLDGVKEPLLLRRPLSSPLLTDEGLLSILKAWGEQARRGQAEAVQLIEKLDAGALPEASDATLDGFIERLGARWSKDWYMYATNVHQYDGELWERVVEASRPALRRAGGLPPCGVRTEIFCGRYDVTPTGIHLDASDNVAFVLRGPKRMLFWPPGRFEPRQSSPDGGQSQALTARYRDHLGDAIVIEAQAGDVIFWPKEYWHVGVASDAPAWSAMLTIAFWWNAPLGSLTRFFLNSLPAPPDAPGSVLPCAFDRLASAAAEVPGPIAELIARTRANVAENLELTSRLLWAYYATSYGFFLPPAPAPAPPVSAETRLRVKHPVAVLRAADALVVVACGRLAEARPPNAERVLEGLRVGAAFAAGDACEFSSLDGGARRAWLELLRALVAFRALEVVGA